ncbi:hypothetical protein G7046_g10137 [Stylonectria norvegica]|nr:hypothetical protein G7046_g10137 [Stylonectria norvegica]
MATAPKNQAGDCAKAQEELPPLSSQDFKLYNQMAVMMNVYHDHFRQQWNLLWTASTTRKRPQGMTLKQLLDEGLSFAHYLTMHHGIEERYFFPILAKKMPEFQIGTAQLLAQHEEIHAGLEGFEAYLKACQAREVDFEFGVLHSKMEPWEKVLWTHLDQEVKTLGANNMRRYWTKDEMNKLASTLR